MSLDYSNLSDLQIRYELATKVMGWKLFNYEEDSYGNDGDWIRDASNNDGWHWEGDEDREAWQWDPTQDWNHTMEVVERMQQLQSRNGDHWDFILCLDGTFKCCVFGELQDDGVTLTHKDEVDPKRAICLAALKSVTQPNP